MDKEDNMETDNNMETTQIRHIVVSGGGISGFTAYGILRDSAKSGFWDINNIQTFYGTSVGGLLLLMLILKFDWDTLDDYIIKRPWQNVFHLNMYSLINSIQTVGIFNINTIESFCEPLFKAKDIKMDVSMKEFFDITGIEFHLFATEFNETVLVDISYKTHPEWKVIESLYCSCCLPIMFKPYTKEDKIYCDGGVFSNYPLSHCYNNMLSKEECIKTDEIFGIKTSGINNVNFEINDESSLFDYIALMIKKLICKISLNDYIPIKNEIIIESNIVSIYDDIYLALSDMEKRIDLIQRGVILWDEFKSLQK